MRVEEWSSLIAELRGEVVTVTADLPPEEVVGLARTGAAEERGLVAHGRRDLSPDQVMELVRGGEGESWRP
jgi:hypothetical protein